MGYRNESIARQTLLLRRRVNAEEAQIQDLINLRSFLASHIMTDHLTSVQEVNLIPMEGDILGSSIKENEEVAEAMSRCDRDLWRIKELRYIVNEYMDSSLVNLESLITLHKCCNHARESLSLIFLVLQQFDEEEAQGIASNSDGVDGQRYAKTQETLAKLMGAVSPFPEDFLVTIDTLRRRQISMLNTLNDMYTKLNEKMKGKGIEVLRNVLSTIISATSMTVGVCADGMAEMAVPPVARVVEAGASSVIGLMKVPWRKVPDKGWEESINTLHFRHYAAINNLSTLDLLASRLKFTFDTIMQCVDLAAREIPVKLCVMEMRNLSKDIGLILSDLEDHACLGLTHIGRARSLLQQMVREIPKKD